MDYIRDLGRAVYKGWMAFGRVLGIVNATILLTVVYIVVIGPMSIASKILRKDLLTHCESSETFWKPKEPLSNTLDESRHQF